MAIRFTAHAQKRLLQRRILESWVRRTIEAPDWLTPEPSDPRLTRAYKRLSAAGGRILRVVYLARNEHDILVITAFPDRDAQPPV